MCPGRQMLPWRSDARGWRPRALPGMINRIRVSRRIGRAQYLPACRAARLIYCDNTQNTLLSCFFLILLALLAQLHTAVVQGFHGNVPFRLHPKRTHRAFLQIACHEQDGDQRHHHAVRVCQSQLFLHDLQAAEAHDPPRVSASTSGAGKRYGMMGIARLAPRNPCRGGIVSAD